MKATKVPARRSLFNVGDRVSVATVSYGRQNGRVTEVRLDRTCDWYFVTVLGDFGKRLVGIDDLTGYCRDVYPDRD